MTNDGTEQPAGQKVTFEEIVSSGSGSAGKDGSLSQPTEPFFQRPKSTESPRKFAPLERRGTVTSVNHVPQTLRQKIRRTLYRVFEPSAPRAGKKTRVATNIVSCIILGAVILSCTAYCVESLPVFVRAGEDDVQVAAFQAIETLCTAIFATDYLVRLATCERIRVFVVSPLNIIDLCSILPYIISKAAEHRGSNFLLVLRSIRIVRVLRVFRLSRYSTSLQVVLQTLQSSYDAVVMIIIVSVVSVTVFASLIYLAELNEAVFDGKRFVYRDGVGEFPFQNFTDAIWFVAVSSTTVGYGDIVVRGPIAKCATAVAMIWGVVQISLPSVVVGANFVKVREARLLIEKNKNSLWSKLESAGRPETDPSSVLDNDIPIISITSQVLGIRPASSPKFAITRAVLDIIHGSVISGIFLLLIQVTDKTFVAASRMSNGVQYQLVLLRALCMYCILELLGRMVCYIRIPKFYTRFHLWIDVVSVLPIILEHVGGRQWAYPVYSLCLLRIYRLHTVVQIVFIKWPTVHSGLMLYVKAISRSLNGLLLLAVLMGLITLISASAIYLVETAACTFRNGVWSYRDPPELLHIESDFQSIPHSFWWAMVTLCTVGFGDQVPHTGLGRSIAGLVFVCGILCLIFPITIMGNTYDEMRRTAVTEKEGLNTDYIEIELRPIGFGVGSFELSASPCVLVTVLRARVTNTNVFGVSTPLVYVSSDNGHAFVTEEVGDTLTPEFEERFEVPVETCSSIAGYLPTTALFIEVRDKASDSLFMGGTVVPLHLLVVGSSQTTSLHLKSAAEYAEIRNRKKRPYLKGKLLNEAVDTYFAMTLTATPQFDHFDVNTRGEAKPLVDVQSIPILWSPAVKDLSGTYTALCLEKQLEAIAAVVDAFKHASELCVSFESIELTPEQILVILEVLEPARNLRHLSFCKTGITNSEVRAICRRVALYPVLAYLDLSHNLSITDACEECLIAFSRAALSSVYLAVQGTAMSQESRSNILNGCIRQALQMRRTESLIFQSLSSSIPSV